MAEMTYLNRAELEEPLFQSRSSEVFAYDGDDKLLKLFRSSVPQEEVDQEEINTAEIFRCGATDVACYGQARVTEEDGTVRSGIILKKVPGKTMIAYLDTDPTILFRAAEIMAEKQVALHALTSDKIRSYKDYVRYALQSPVLQELLTERDLEEVERRLSALPDKKNILHLDYHPDNIMTDGTHTTIIDFMTACTGDPAADVAAARIVLTKGEMIQSLSPIMKLAMNLVKRAVCSRYVKQYQKKTGLTRAEMDAWNFAFYIVRLGIWNIESEKERFSQLLLEDLRK